MPFSISEFINNISNFVLTSPFTSGIIKNPVYTGIAIGVLVMIMIVIIFRNTETEDPLWKITLKVGVYTSIIAISFIFFHNAYLKNEYELVSGGKDLDVMFAGVQDGVLSPTSIKTD